MTRSRLRLALGRVLRSLWFAPALYAAAAVAALALAPAMATVLPDGLMTLIGLDGVYNLLDALAGTLLAVAIFSLGILAASMRATSSAATPRIRPLLAEDRAARRAISTFIGGFVYAVVGIVVLSTGYYGSAAKVLVFFITGAVIVALIVALVRWIGRLSRLGGVAEAVDLAAEATGAALLDLAREPFLGGREAEAERPAEDRPDRLVGPARPGFVHAIDMEELSSLAEELGVDLVVGGRPGAWVGPGHPLLVAGRALTEDERRRLAEPFVLGARRTFEADPRFGLAVLSEIASRALSPAVNDPGTAIDVVATSTRLLCEWSAQAAGARPETRFQRLRVRPVTAEQLLEDAFRWIARDGAGLAEVQLWLLKGLRMLVAQDAARFGPAARALARQALARSEVALTVPSDLDPLRRLLAEIERG